MHLNTHLIFQSELAFGGVQRNWFALKLDGFLRSLSYRTRGVLLVTLPWCLILKCSGFVGKVNYLVVEMRYS